MREFTRIAKYFAPLAHPQYALNLKDDAALLDVPQGHQLAITSDTLNAGIHFTGDETADLIARKALRVNLSDLAAMGAKPVAYSLNLALPKDCDEAFLAAFAQGLARDQKHYGVSLVGGDSTATHGPLSISITAYGLVKKGSALRRSGAKLGDAIYVTGNIGEAALGLEVAQRKRAHDAHLLQRYQLPEPQTEYAQTLIGTATACMDISDGLVQDLEHLCSASNVGAELRLDAIPLADKQAYEQCLTGGDDYELLFTAQAGLTSTICKITEIGKIVEKDVRILDGSGEALHFSQKGFQHF